MYDSITSRATAPGPCVDDDYDSKDGFTRVTRRRRSPACTLIPRDAGIFELTRREHES